MQLTVSICNHVGFDIVESQVNSILRMNRGGRRLRHDWQGAGLPAMDVGTVVQKNGMRRLGQMGAEADLVALSARDCPESGFFASQLHQPSLESLDGWVAVNIVDIVVHRGLEDSL